MSWLAEGFSDILEPGRDWRNNRWLNGLVSPLREAVYEGQLIGAAVMIAQRLAEWYTEQGVAIHPNIRRVANSVSLKN